MSVTESTVAAGKPTAATLDDLMLAMDVVDTLRHREQLVERELSEDVRDERLIERLRALYKSQGIDVPDTILADGVTALKESRFAYTPPVPSFARTLATIWVKRGTYGKLTAIGLATLAVFVGAYYFGVVQPRERAAQSAQVEITQTLPRQLAAAHSSVVAEAQSPAVRQRADAILARGRAALERGNVVDARAAIAELDQLAALLRREYVLRIAGRPQDQTGFFREHPSFQGRAYFIVVDAVDPDGKPVELPVHNDETNKTETVSRFAVRVPIETFDAVRNDKARNGIVQNARMAEKRRGFIEPEFRMPVLEGRITRW
jgi:uncharacterized protein DUF6384